ncbi:MAG: hypothetical protein M3R49_06465 [Chloroflexota bacterium]|nr:hypothetical protein [Chloroflexota bacterium]
MLLYLEADDEITTVVRRLRESDGENVVLVAPGRARALTSSVALRLLARTAADEGRSVALVADATTRSLAAEAGIATFASVADAEQGVAAELAAPTRAQIHVVQGDEPTALVTTPGRTEQADETRAVRIAVAPVQKRARRLPWLAVVAALALLLVAGAAAAVVAPAATIRLAPQAEVVGPKTYDLTLAADVLSGTLQSKTTGHATAKYVDRTAASGVVVFQNFNTYPVDVPAGSQVAAGEIVFATTEAVAVPPGTFVGAIQSGDQAAAVVAAHAGPAGNVGPGAINRVVDPQIDARLQGYPTISEPRVRNPDATAGGKEATGPQIKKEDVDAAAAALRKDLESQLAKVLGDQAGRLSPARAAPAPVIAVAKGLVGTRDRATFELSGTLAYDHRSVQIADVEAAARERLASDAAAIPAGTELLADTVQVTPGEVTVAGDRLRVPARVTAQAAPRLDPATVRNRVAGLSADAARSALTEYGAVDLKLWPGWVRTVPNLSWRIEVIIDPVRRT